VHKVDGSNGDLWIIDVSRGTTTRFTLDAHKANYPIWSPDGTRIVFAAEGDSGRFNLHQKNAGGAGAEELLLKSDHVQVPEDWSADGHFILFRDLDPKNGPDLWALPMTGDRKPEPYLQSPFVEGQARFSPNGRWVAYTSNESGRNEVFIQSFPASARKYPVSSNGGVQPRWRGDGKELYFLAGIVSPNVATVTAVDVIESKDTLAIGAERPLFETTVQSKVRERNTWEVTPDGQRFLINRSDQADSVLTRPITVVVNWKPGVARR